MSRVLVTGATGFLGRHVLGPLLAAGCEVHVAGRTAPSASGLPFHHADLLAPDEGPSLVRAIRPDIVVHLAWTVEHGRFWTAPENRDWAAATIRLARAAAQAGCGRFVGTGTCAEYDWSVDPGRPRVETDPLAASQLYGECKIATLRALEGLFAGTGTTFAWARVFHPFGAGEPAGKLLPSLVRTLREGGTMTIRSGPFLRDFIAAEDAGAAIAGLALAGAEGAVNIASGVPCRVRDLAETVQALVGGPGRIVFAEPQPGGEPAVMTADVTRLRRECGVAAPPPLRQRLQDWLAQEP